MDSAEKIGGLNQYSIFITKFQKADKMTPNWKLATIFKTNKEEGNITYLWAIFIHMHQYINKPYYLLRLAITGSRNSWWRSSKPEALIFHLVYQITMRFQVIILCFRGRAVQWRRSHTTTEVGSQDGRHYNVSSYNSALTQCNEKILMIIGILFPWKTIPKRTT